VRQDPLDEPPYSSGGNTQDHNDHHAQNEQSAEVAGKPTRIAVRERPRQVPVYPSPGQNEQRPRQTTDDEQANAYKRAAHQRKGIQERISRPLV
jgi:hypothetical protein